MRRRVAQDHPELVNDEIGDLNGPDTPPGLGSDHATALKLLRDGDPAVIEVDLRRGQTQDLTILSPHPSPSAIPARKRGLVALEMATASACEGTWSAVTTP